MGAECVCYSWIYRPVLPIVIILATITCMVHCSESPAAVVGKMYPRGNHWAVGHLMGKKSIESMPGLQGSSHERDYLIPLERGDKLLDQYDHQSKLVQALLKALVHQETHKQMPFTAHRLFLLRSSWKEDNRDEYLREMSDLLLLGMSLKENRSS